MKKSRIPANRRFFVCGKPQVGKTFFVKYALLKQYKNLFIYDIKGEYSGFGAVATTIQEMAHLYASGCFSVVYQPLTSSPDHFNAVMGWIWEHLRNTLIVVDEVHSYTGSNYIPENFKDIITIGMGEPYNLGLINITQRPANTHGDVKGCANYVIVFKCNLLRDAKAVENITGIPAENIQKLRKHEYYLYDDSNDEEPYKLCKPVKSR